MPCNDHTLVAKCSGRVQPSRQCVKIALSCMQAPMFSADKFGHEEHCVSLPLEPSFHKTDTKDTGNIARTFQCGAI